MVISLGKKQTKRKKEKNYSRILFALFWQLMVRESLSSQFGEDERLRRLMVIAMFEDW